MGFVEAYCFAEESIRAEVEVRECVVENVGQVKVPATDNLAGDAELVRRCRRQR